MQEYHKIQSIFKRDPDNNFKTFIDGDWSLPEFEYLADNSWAGTEKVDGTNIRVIYEANGFENTVIFKGKTEKAQIPPFLLIKLAELFPVEHFIENELPSLCLYGEGYGAKIQKAGGNYIPDGVCFVLFDVMINGIWLERENIEDIGKRLHIKVVPVVFIHTLINAIELIKSKTLVSSWNPSVLAEGLVLKPECELKDRLGNRIITKIKHKDFE